MICYGWNEMGIVETARDLLRDDGGIGTIEHVTAVMASGVRDLLTTGTAYQGSADESPPRARRGATRRSAAAATVRGS